MSSSTPPHLSRRRFLMLAGGTVAAPALLAACGDDDTGGAGDDGGDGDLALAQYFSGPMFAPAFPVRAPFAVADIDGRLGFDTAPARLSVVILGPQDEEVAGPIEVERHGDGLARPYYPLAFEVDEPGIYTARSELDGQGAEMAIQIHAEDELTVIVPGQELPALETPTVDDAQGVTPICTRDPQCSLHEVTVASALGEDRPLALLVATPEFCQVAVCGPVLDILLEAVPDHPDVRFIHAEVYTDPEAAFDNGEPAPEDFAPVVRDLGLHYEPVLVLVGADGVVRERLDIVYDRVELAQALSRLTAS